MTTYYLLKYIEVIGKTLWSSAILAFAASVIIVIGFLAFDIWLSQSTIWKYQSNYSKVFTDFSLWFVVTDNTLLVVFLGSFLIIGGFRFSTTVPQRIAMIPTPTRTPYPTSTFTPRPTATPKPTSTFTPRPTATPKPTSTFTPRPTATPKPTSTNTPRQPTLTRTPTSTRIRPTLTSTKNFKLPQLTSNICLPDKCHVQGFTGGLLISTYGKTFGLFNSGQWLVEDISEQEARSVSHFKCSTKPDLDPRVKWGFNIAYCRFHEQGSKLGDPIDEGGPVEGDVFKTTPLGIKADLKGWYGLNSILIKTDGTWQFVN